MSMSPQDAGENPRDKARRMVEGKGGAPEWPSPSPNPDPQESMLGDKIFAVAKSLEDAGDIERASSLKALVREADEQAQALERLLRIEEQDLDPYPARDPHVWIRFEDDMFVCGDEDGEFARAGSEKMILPYVADLLYGPGTLRDGGLAERASLTEKEEATDG